MAVKDRLPELLAARKGSKKDNLTTVVFINDKHQSLDQFHEEVQQIGQNIEEIEYNVNKIKKLQNVLLFGAQTDINIEKELDGLVADTQRLLLKVKNRIQVIEQNITDMRAEQSSTSAIRIRETQKSMLLKRFMDVMTTYNESQIQFKDSCKSRIKRQLEIMGNDTNNEELDKLLESKNDVFIQGFLSDTKSAKQDLNEINARHRELIKVEKSIVELHQMFIEMELLATEQGEKLDIIESNVSNAASKVESGNDQLAEGLQSQKKSRKKKIIIFAILLIILVAFIIFLVLQF